LRRKIGFLLALLLVVLAFGGLLVWRWYRGDDIPSNRIIRDFLVNVDKRPQMMNRSLTQCAGAPFILPSEGLIGLLYADPSGPYTVLRRHTGLDIFGDGASGTLPIYAVYDGYLTRREDWLSTVIIRHADPLQAGRSIWTYYTHMASRDASQSYVSQSFPPGVSEVFVPQGTLLGYQGEYAGTGTPIAMHLHFSIVTTGADGNFLNEAVLDNTLDPSPYFRMPLRVDDNPPRPVPCG
jgi:hypothetical protein